LRRAADKVPERIALIGTGGLSHWPATPDSGKINHQWDREFLRRWSANDREALLSYTDAETYREAGQGGFEIRTFIAAAAAAFAAALGGAWIATQVPPLRFRAMVPLLLAAVLVYTLLHRDFGRDHRPRRNGRYGRMLAAVGAGLIGLYDGFFGPGTGSFLMFLFVRVFGMDFLHASASAKVVNAAANLAAILLFGLTGEVFWLLGIAMAACNVAGALLGTHLAIRHGSGFVRLVFILVVGCLIAKTAWDAFAP